MKKIIVTVCVAVLAAAAAQAQGVKYKDDARRVQQQVDTVTQVVQVQAERAAVEAARANDTYKYLGREGKIMALGERIGQRDPQRVAERQAKKAERKAARKEKWDKFKANFSKVASQTHPAALAYK